MAHLFRILFLAFFLRRFDVVGRRGSVRTLQLEAVAIEHLVLQQLQRLVHTGGLEELHEAVAHGENHACEER